VADLLTFADMDRVAACLAPRPVLVAGSAPAGGARGTLKVLRTMQAVYGLYEAPDRIQRMPGQSSDDTTPYLAEICRWIEVDVLPGLTGSDAAPRACGPPEDADFSMLGHMQRRIADRTASLPVETSSEADWQGFRDRVVQWLRESCALDRMRADPDQVVEVAEGEVLVTEQLALGLDADFRCPAVLIRPAAPDPARRAGVVLSHDDRQCAASAKIAEAARRLASNGYWVIVPDHASVEPQSRQTLADPERPRFYGDEAARFYGPADAVGLPPLALRVAENLAAFRYLAGRLEGDADKIVVAGLGTGGVDACLAAVLDERIAGVASVDATTVRDWSHNVAPGELRFFHIMPYLPSMCSLQARRPTADRPSGSSPSEHPEIPPAVDWDGFYAALAPRPLVIVRLKDGWPRSGCEQVAATASAIYQRQGAENALLALGPRDVTEELETNTPSGILKQLVAAARTLVPTPPQPGIVGSLDGLRSRRVVDTASGLIWIVAEMNGYDQEFAGSEYRLETWSFFNDNGGAQQGRRITPLVFKKEGDRYQLTGIGTTRTNAGTGVQTFEFEPVDGSALVGDGYFFGWHTGDREGHHNPGVAEFEDAPDSLMIILTADGQMGAQQLKIGASYRLQSQFRRRYSVMAVSKKP
jgi:dienelactone hydrolase